MNDFQAPLYTTQTLVDEMLNRLQARGLMPPQSDRRIAALPDKRTLRYYTSLGLLDPPVIVKRQAHYQDQHALQLTCIKALQLLNLPLKQIQTQLYGKTPAELEQLLQTIAARYQAEPDPLPVVYWQEIQLEPGLKIMVQNDWQPSDIDQLKDRFVQSLTQLKQSPNKSS